MTTRTVDEWNAIAGFIRVTGDERGEGAREILHELADRIESGSKLSNPKGEATIVLNRADEILVQDAERGLHDQP